MTREFFTLSCSILLLSFSLALAEDKPNIIYILADDLGYGEVGFNGQKLMQTPALDKMASRGMVWAIAM